MKILLVDDDKLICRWLTMLINRLAQENVYVDSVNSTEDAIRYCDRNRVDLVITDINMPQGTGLKLLAELPLKHPNIKMAVLSAYDDYKYMREALKMGALDYILKTDLNENDIIALMNKVQMAYELETYERGAKARLKEIVEQHNVNNENLELFLDKKISVDTFLEKAHIKFKLNERVGLIVFRADETKLLNKDIMDNISGILCRTLKNELFDGDVFYIKPAYFVMIFGGLSIVREHQESTFERLALISKRNVKEYVGGEVITVLTGDGKDKNTLYEDISCAVKDADAMSYYRLSERTKFKPLDESVASQLNRDVVRVLRTKKFEEAFLLLQDFIENMHVQRVYPQELKRVIVLLLATFNSSVALTNGRKLMLEGFDELLSAIINADTEERFVSHVSAFGRNFITKEPVKNNFSLQIVKAISYIEENFDEKITVDDIAAYVYMNKSYLSEVFTQQVGVSIGSYIEKVRMQAAIEILAQDDKNIAEVAQQIGYSSQSYFTKVFNKYTGMPPKEYQRTFGKGNGQYGTCETN